MTTEATSHEGDNQGSEGDHGNQVNVEEQMTKLSERLKQLESSNERLLEESQTWKSKYQGVKSEVDKKEEERMIAEGKTEELAKRYQEEAEKWQKNYKSLRTEVVDGRINTEILKLAPEAYDIKDLRNNFSPEALKIGEDLSVKGIETEIERLKKSKPYLFKSEQRSKQYTKKAPGTGDHFNSDDKEAYHAELAKCKTQAQIDDVRRKYGRDPNYNN